ncbi:MAG TPA: metalloregulator ArsR/SmtB family transcription factor [Burkholderiaceae bacterium]
MQGLPPDALSQVADYFRALSEPTRLQILNVLRSGERNVGELAEACGFTSANVSRHLAVLTQQGLVDRESRGTAAYYRIADESVYALCDLVCGSIARQLERSAQDRKAFARAQAPAGGARRRGS